MQDCKLSKSSGKKPEARTYEINPNFLRSYMIVDLRLEFAYKK
jgi:hypothetical protein